MLLDWENSAFAFGIIRPKDRPRNERRKTHWTSRAAVDAFVDLTPLPNPFPPETDEEPSSEPSSEPGAPRSVMEGHIEQEFLGAYVKLRIATINFVVSVRPFAWKTPKIFGKSEKIQVP
jgi:hypothetical protein